MAGNITIPDLPPGTALDGTEPFETVQTGNSVQVTAQQIADFVGSSSFVPSSYPPIQCRFAILAQSRLRTTRHNGRHNQHS